MPADAAVPDLASDPLDAVAVRVLGALVEKAFTTPDNYPLSLNALTAACNQASNRAPVMTLAEADVATGVRELIRRSLVREVHRSDSRVKRYRHLLGDTLPLHAPEQAALCVLLLRGPQTPGEIKGRTARMAEFVDLSHVEITLQSLA
ncbi:MAG TPA: YceH family protein, partial [Longimicrobiales bacterium]|nr:YceH family protein [Longimicrobiales bacterium]